MKLFKNPSPDWEHCILLGFSWYQHVVAYGWNVFFLIYHQWEKNSFEMTFQMLGYLAQGLLHRDHANRKMSNRNELKYNSSALTENHPKWHNTNCMLLKNPSFQCHDGFTVQMHTTKYNTCHSLAFNRSTKHQAIRLNDQVTNPLTSRVASDTLPTNHLSLRSLNVPSILHVGWSVCNKVIGKD